MKRSLNSASNLHRRFICPASALAEAAISEEWLDVTDNAFSAEGTLLHVYDASPELDRNVLSEPQVQALEKNEALRETFLAKQMEKLGIPFDAERIVILDNDPENRNELFLCDLNGLPVDPPFLGHADRIIYFPQYKVAFIFDSKFGRIEVPAASINLQLRSYVVMVAENFECDKIYAAITQPWVAEPADFHCAEYQGKDIPQFKAEILQILAATRLPNAPFVATMDACRYCRAAHDCVAAQDIVTSIAESRIKEMPLGELELLYEKSLVAEATIAKIKNRLKYVAASNPELLIMWELEKSGCTREVADTKKAYEQLVEKPGYILAEDPAVSGAEFASVCQLSRSQLEIMAARNRGVTHDEMKKRVREELGDLIIEEQKQPKLIRKKHGL